MPGIVAGVQVTSATIAAAASLSGAVDVGAAKVVRISMPEDWTAANLTFQILGTNGIYQNFYDNFGSEYTITADADREIVVPLTDFLGVQAFKIRSGTAATPVAQAAARTIGVVLVA